MLVDPHCQLLYPFENQANDYSGHARHGTVNGSGVYATRPNGGRCLYFDGVGDYVATPSFGLSGTVVVFAADVRCKWLANYQMLLASEPGPSGYFYCHRVANSDGLNWDYYDGAGYRNIIENGYFTAPFNDVWLHMLIICDYAGKKTYFYRNGIPFGSPVAMSGTPVFPSPTGVKYLGSHYPLYFLTAGYLANVQLETLQTCPTVAELTANANRLMLGLHPIWSV
jgi:hypothetical protein